MFLSADKVPGFSLVFVCIRSNVCMVDHCMAGGLGGTFFDVDRVLCMFSLCKN